MKIIDKLKEFFKEEKNDGWNFKEQPKKLELPADFDDVYSSEIKLRVGDEYHSISFDENGKQTIKKEKI